MKSNNLVKDQTPIHFELFCLEKSSKRLRILEGWSQPGSVQENYTKHLLEIKKKMLENHILDNVTIVERHTRLQNVQLLQV